MVAAVTDAAMYQNCLKLNRYEPGWLARASLKDAVRFVEAVETCEGVVDVVMARMTAVTLVVRI